MKNRSYNQFCALAFALDVIGERWSMLIIRELLAGPRRYKDLMEGLPEISTNLLSDRLKTLEQQGIISRRALTFPAGTYIYALTPTGRALEKSLVELGRWGAQFLPSSLEGFIPPSTGSTALAIKAFFRPEQAQGIREIYELHLGAQVLQIQVEEGDIDVQEGQTLEPTARFYTDLPSYMAVFSGQLDIDDAISAGMFRVEGDLEALRRFLKLSRVSHGAA
jgi:DNA-binding HxlR family transcriptional regulator